MVTHLKHHEDAKLLKYPLINVVVGGHDHEPHIHMEHEKDHVERPQKLAVKVGLDGQYLAKIDLFFSEHDIAETGGKGQFDHIHFDMRNVADKKLCHEGQVGCEPASIVPIDGRKYPQNPSMLGLIDSFENL